MPTKLSRRQFAGTAAAVLIPAAHAAEWKGTRQWIGPEYWANPLPTWHMEDGVVVAAAGQNRTLHLLTQQARGDFEMRVEILGPRAGGSWAGFRFGARGKLDDFRYSLIHSEQWVDAAIGVDGKLTLDGKQSADALPQGGWIQLTLAVRGGSAELSAQAGGRR